MSKKLTEEEAIQLIRSNLVQGIDTTGINGWMVNGIKYLETLITHVLMFRLGTCFI